MFYLQSRIHKLNQFPNSQCYIKRDDELSFGISGSKLRKYASLIPYMQKNHYQGWVVIAGQQSNNLLACLQLSREFQIDCYPFILKSHEQKTKGNFKFSSLFLEPQNTTWIERQDWPNVQDSANQFIEKHPDKLFLLPEGAFTQEALTGAKTLALDILRNEQQQGIQFKHIFIEAGSGLSAIGLIQGLKEQKHSAKVYVLLLADRESAFRQKFLQLTGEHSFNGECFYPVTAKSFGSVNRSIREAVKQFALEEGLLTDMIYSAKLLMNAKMKMYNLPPQEPALVIHSGGALSLTGFDI